MKVIRNFKGQIATWLTGVALMVLLLILAIPLISPQNDSLAPMPRTENNEPQGGGPGIDNYFVNVSDINSNPEAYTGKVIRVNGEMDEIIASRVFRLDQDDVITGDEILVIAAVENTNDTERENTSNLRNVWNVVVRGEVRKMDINEIEKELNIDLSPEVEENYQGKYIIVADLITPISESR